MARIMTEEEVNSDQRFAGEKKEIERVDLVDSSGAIQKNGVLRSDVGLYPDLHLQIVIGVIFDKEGRILVHRRAQTKEVNPGDIDHVCGGVKSGEKPEEALVREADEETATKPQNLRIILQGVNTYSRYRYLFVGEFDGEPEQGDPTEVEWVRFIDPDELREKLNTGEFTFVDEFFEDTEMATQNRAL